MHKFASPAISTVSLEPFWLTVFSNELTKKTAEEYLSENKMPLKLQAALAGSSKSKFAGKGIYAYAHAKVTHFESASDGDGVCQILCQSVCKFMRRFLKYLAYLLTNQNGGQTT